MIREAISDTLLVLAVLTVAASALGVAVSQNAYARLHYVTPAAVVAPVLVALAVFVTEGLDQNTGETVLALVFLVAAAPFLSHATIRAARIREQGNWRRLPPIPESAAPESAPQESTPPDSSQEESAAAKDREAS